MRRDERVTDEMVELACKAITEKRGFVWPDEFSEDEKQTGRENIRAAISAALSIEQTQPVAHLVWRQYLRAADDVEDYYEVARPGDKCVDGSEPFPVYAHPPLSALVNAQADADVVERWQPIDTAPKDGVRVILMWEPFGGVSEHVELGKWSIRNGWVNTYGHAFTGSPTHWMPLPPPSTTRIADSAEAGGSATSTTGTGGGDG